MEHLTPVLNRAERMPRNLTFGQIDERHPIEAARANNSLAAA
jgi:hypothetical protein